MIRRTLGVTLVELLVVIALIGLLVSLLIPSVSSSLESTRRLACQNRLRSVSLAALQFESANSRLPPGTLGVARAYSFRDDYDTPSSDFYWKKHQFTSSLAFILPFLEHQGLVDGYPKTAFDVTRSLESEYEWFGAIPGFAHIVAAEVADFRCPSDPLAATPDFVFEKQIGALQPVFLPDTQTDAVAWTDLLEEEVRSVGVTNYLAVAGAHSGGRHEQQEFQKYTGLMTIRDGSRISDSRDGASRTAIFGETLGEVESRKRTIMQSWFVGGIGRGRGAVDWQGSPVLGSLFGDGATSSFIGFGSQHPATVGFSFADGRAEPISRNTDWQIIYSICGANDGKAL